MMLKIIAGLAIGVVFMAVIYYQYKKTKSGGCCGTGPADHNTGKD